MFGLCNVKLTKPGMEHSSDGAWLWFVDVVDEIDNWIESGKVPKQLTAFWTNMRMHSVGSHRACVYSKYPMYNGSGDPRDAPCFSCVNPD
jgi:feruloyl esterase